MAAELRRAVRSLRRAPGFLAASVLLLVLAIAPTVGVFRLTDVVLLRQLSTPRPEELVVFEKVATDGDTDTSFSYPIYRDLRDRAAGLSHLVAYDASMVALQSGDTTERVLRELVSGNYFQCLQTKAVLGRLLLPEDDQQPGAHPVAVLTHGYWRERFGGDASILGQTIRLNGYPFTVIGVAEPRFRGLRAGFRPAVVVPMMMQGQLEPAWQALERRGTSWLKIIGRLKSRAARQAVEARASTDYQNLVREDLAGASLPDSVRQEVLAERVRLAPGGRGFSPLASRYGRPLTVVLVMTVILWVVAALNFLSLFVARFTAQRSELAVRSALGATSSRLALEVFAELAIIAVLGGCTGFAFASPFAMALLRFVPTQNSPLDTGTSVDLRLVGLALGLTVVTMAVVGAYICVAPPCGFRSRLPTTRNPADGARLAVREHPQRPSCARRPVRRSGHPSHFSRPRGSLGCESAQSAARVRPVGRRPHFSRAGPARLHALASGGSRLSGSASALTPALASRQRHSRSWTWSAVKAAERPLTSQQAIAGRLVRRMSRSISSVHAISRRLPLR